MIYKYIFKKNSITKNNFLFFFLGFVLLYQMYLSSMIKQNNNKDNNLMQIAN